MTNILQHPRIQRRGLIELLHQSSRQRLSPRPVAAASALILACPILVRIRVRARARKEVSRDVEVHAAVPLALPQGHARRRVSIAVLDGQCRVAERKHAPCELEPLLQRAAFVEEAVDVVNR